MRQVLSLGRVMLHVAHYPEVSFIVKTVSQAFFWLGCPKTAMVLVFSHNPGGTDPRSSTSPTSVPSTRMPTCSPRQSPRNHDKLQTLSLQGPGLTGHINKKLGWCGDTWLLLTEVWPSLSAPPLRPPVDFQSETEPTSLASFPVLTP